jgi:phenylacetate-CoA ligase
MKQITEHLPSWLRFLGVNLYGIKLYSERFNKTFWNYRHFLEESQNWSTKKLEAFQLEKLYDLLRDVAQNVPFYGRHFAESGFSPSQLSSLSDLNRIEPVSKSQLRSAGKACLHREFKRFNPRLFHSSGTTGEKFSYYIPEELRFGLKFATIWRQYSWAGINFRDRRVTLGARIFTSKPPLWVYNVAENQLLLSIHHLNGTTVPQYIDRMEHFKPVFLQGHPSGVHLLARYLVQHDRSLPLKAVFTTGETLFSEYRKTIEKAFSCSVFEEYGQGECVFAAQESAAHAGFHEVSELGIIEFESKCNENLQQVLGTSIWNRAMPFIRYRVEDLVEPVVQAQNTTADIGLPLKIKSVVGRMDESLTTTSGEQVLPVSARMFVKPLLKTAENYQISQIGPKEYVIRLTDSHRYRDHSDFKLTLKKLFGEDAHIDVQYVDSIRSVGGKIRNVVNEYMSNSRIMAKSQS